MQRPFLKIIGSLNARVPAICRSVPSLGGGTSIGRGQSHFVEHGSDMDSARRPRTECTSLDRRGKLAAIFLRRCLREDNLSRPNHPMQKIDRRRILRRCAICLNSVSRRQSEKRSEGSIPPEILEPVRRQRCVDRGAGDRATVQPSLASLGSLTAGFPRS
jgi:hypothetical protein